MLPHIVIIGAMKGGTTSLYHYIASHPNVVASSCKETNFFRSEEDFKKGVDWYRGLFQGNGEFAMEASPSYTNREQFPGVPARMHSVLPECKLIYLLRDPLERIVSHYVHECSKVRETRPFAEAIRRTDRWYCSLSMYYYQIEAYLEYYSRDRLLLIETSELNREPVKVLDRICSFTGLSPDYDHSLVRKRFHESKAKRPELALDTILRRYIRNRYLLGGVNRITNLFRPPIERPIPAKGDIEFIREKIGPDIEKLQQYTGFSFSEWSI